MPDFKVNLCCNSHNDPIHQEGSGLMRQKLKQVIGFGLVGGVNTILTYLNYLTLYQLINPTAAMGVG
ncbi:MAG: GtrA family protein, partial [Lactobacillaceae bacterium]